MPLTQIVLICRTVSHYITKLVSSGVFFFFFHLIRSTKVLLLDVKMWCVEPRLYIWILWGRLCICSWLFLCFIVSQGYICLIRGIVAYCLRIVVSFILFFSFGTLFFAFIPHMGKINLMPKNAACIDFLFPRVI